MFPGFFGPVLPYFSISEMKHTYSSMGYFARLLSKIKGLLKSDLCLLHYAICKSKQSKDSSVSEEAVQRLSAFSKAQAVCAESSDGSVCSTVTLQLCHFGCRSLLALARSFTQTNRPCEEVQHSANMLWCFAAQRYLHTCQVRYFSICMKTSILRCV